jgi:hypothetical protein
LNSKSIKTLSGIVAILTICQVGGLNLLISKAMASDGAVISDETQASDQNTAEITAASENPETVNPETSNPEEIDSTSSSITPEVNIEPAQLPTVQSIVGIKINEFSAKSSPDWVELYNPTGNGVDLLGWSLKDSSNNIKGLSGTISAGGYLVFYWSNILNNGGDSINLYDAGPQLVDSVSYWSGTVPEHTTNQSTGRIPSGSNTWAVFTNPTPGWANDLTPPEVTNPQVEPSVVKGDGLANVLLSVHAVDAIASVAVVKVDLSQMGLFSEETMYDDGTHGDVTASDSIYSLSFNPMQPVDGLYQLPISASDISNNINDQESFSITIDNTPPQILDVTFDPHHVLLGIGGQVTITAFAENNEVGLFAHGSFNGKDLIWQDKGDGRYQAVYTVFEGDSDGTDVLLEDAELMDQAGNVSGIFSPVGDEINIDATRPASPSQLEVKPGDGFVDLSWEKVTDAVSYNIYRTASPEFTKIDSTFTNSFRDETVANGHEYMYKVTSVDEAGNETLLDLTQASSEVTPSALGSVIGEILPFGGGEEIAMTTPTSNKSAASNFVPQAQTVAPQGQVEGTQQPQEEQKQEEQSQSRNWPMIVAIVVAILVVIGGAYYYWTLNQQGNTSSGDEARPRRYKRRISRKK